MDLLFIQTGGTIDKDYPKSTKGWAFEISEPAVERILKKLNPSFKYTIKSVLKKDSLEITDQDRLLLYNKCKAANENKIIITHGTDTMIETAVFLSKLNEKTIVLTGAMRPERFSNSDADLNVGVSLGAVQTLSFGVYISMNGWVLPFDQVVRNMETGQYHKK